MTSPRIIDAFVGKKAVKLGVLDEGLMTVLTSDNKLYLYVLLVTLLMRCSYGKSCPPFLQAGKYTPIPCAVPTPVRLF